MKRALVQVSAAATVVGGVGTYLFWDSEEVRSIFLAIGIAGVFLLLLVWLFRSKKIQEHIVVASADDSEQAPSQQDIQELLDLAIDLANRSKVGRSNSNGGLFLSPATLLVKIGDELVLNIWYQSDTNNLRLVGRDGYVELLRVHVIAAKQIIIRDRVLFGL